MVYLFLADVLQGNVGKQSRIAECSLYQKESRNKIKKPDTIGKKRSGNKELHVKMHSSVTHPCSIEMPVGSTTRTYGGLWWSFSLSTQAAFASSSNLESTYGPP